MRVLISRLSAMGDVVCTLPAATALKANFPDCEITWAVDKRFHAIPRLCPAIDHVWVVPKGLKNIRAEGQELGKFDVALDMQGLLKSAIVAASVKSDKRMGFHWQREGAGLFSQKVLPDPSSIHVVDQYVDVVRALGCEAERAEFGLVPSEEDLESVKAKLTEAGRDWSKPLVLFNAGAGWVTKRWDPAHFAKVTAAVIEAGGDAFYLGAPGDEVAFGEVHSAGGDQAKSMIAKTSISELVALISLCTAHIAGDTGSTHIAAALGKPLVGVYTLTRPERSGPYGQVGNCQTLDPDEVTQLLLGKVFS